MIWAPSTRPTAATSLSDCSAACCELRSYPQLREARGVVHRRAIDVGTELHERLDSIRRGRPRSERKGQEVSHARVSPRGANRPAPMTTAMASNEAGRRTPRAANSRPGGRTLIAASNEAAGRAPTAANNGAAGRVPIEASSWSGFHAPGGMISAEGYGVSSDCGRWTTSTVSTVHTLPAVGRCGS
jgi:hypothetical protein